jgi:hypothetical protein
MAASAVADTSKLEVDLAKDIDAGELGMPAAKAAGAFMQ